MNFKPLFVFEMANNHNGKVDRNIKAGRTLSTNF